MERDRGKESDTHSKGRRLRGGGSVGILGQLNIKSEMLSGGPTHHISR